MELDRQIVDDDGNHVVGGGHSVGGGEAEGCC